MEIQTQKKKKRREVLWDILTIDINNESQNSAHFYVLGGVINIIVLFSISSNGNALGKIVCLLKFIQWLFH